MYILTHVVPSRCYFQLISASCAGTKTDVGPMRHLWKLDAKSRQSLVARIRQKDKNVIKFLTLGPKSLAVAYVTFGILFFKMYKTNYNYFLQHFRFCYFLSVIHYAGLRPDAFLHKISDFFFSSDLLKI